MARTTPIPLAAAALAALLAMGCAPEIGDECTSSADCSADGTRICDLASPGGYCTVQGCEQDTCPDDSVCVVFRPDPARLATSWCMAPCGDDAECRDDYECTRASELTMGDEEVARVLDTGGDANSFCIAIP